MNALLMAAQEPVLKAATGKLVTVWTNVTGIKKNFGTGFSITGKLEAKTGGKKEVIAYRVVNSDGNYCYFTIEDVEIILCNNEFDFGEGARVSIQLKLNYR